MPLPQAKCKRVAPSGNLARRLFTAARVTRGYSRDPHDLPQPRQFGTALPRCGCRCCASLGWLPGQRPQPCKAHVHYLAYARWSSTSLAMALTTCAVQHGAHTCSVLQSERGAFPDGDTNAAPVCGRGRFLALFALRSSTMAMRPCRVLVPSQTASLAACLANPPASRRDCSEMTRSPVRASSSRTTSTWQL